MVDFAKIPPLDWQSPMVDPNTGIPTAQFRQLWQQLFQNTQASEEGLGGKADKSTEIIAGEGLEGGGNLSEDRTISLNAELNDLTDVDTVTSPPADGQGLGYDESSGLWVPTTFAGGGGGGWAPVTFSGAAVPKWGGYNSFQSDDTVALTTGDLIEIELVVHRAAAASVSLALSLDGESCYINRRQDDNNWVYYRYATSGGSSILLEGGSFNDPGEYYEVLGLTVAVSSAGLNQRSQATALRNSLKYANDAYSNVPLVGDASVWVQANSLSDIVSCQYRKVS